MTALFNSDISIDEFLAGYWQRKPLLLRQAFPDLEAPLTPDELAGLACEPDSNARLVLESCGTRPWSVEYGPFEEQRFAELPQGGWSLLVSDMERMLPELRELQRRFRFIPDWRNDDVMLSFAPDGGSVGPHVDRYDVFLLQVHGQRRWTISEHFEEHYLDDTDLEILRGFDAEQEWLLQAGDMLYLPPRVAHHGVAVGDGCMTCSIGFRTPASGQLASEFMETLCRSRNSEHYSDAGMARQRHSAEITRQSLQQLRDMIESMTAFDDATLTRWFGEYISENRSNSDREFETADITGADTLAHHPDRRFLFARAGDDGGDRAIVFVDGDSFDTSTAFAETLCRDDRVSLAKLRAGSSEDDERALQQLLAAGHLVATDD